MYLFGIDVQLNILVALNLLAVLVEFMLVWKILMKLKKQQEHKKVQMRMKEERVGE
ncbi:MAG: hypothetical protein QXT19_01250 [Candidatus Woesearchaeota archaeon]